MGCVYVCTCFCVCVCVCVWVCLCVCVLRVPPCVCPKFYIQLALPIGENGPKIVPKWSQNDQKWQNGTKMVPKWSQNSPKWSQNGLKIVPLFAILEQLPC